MKINVFKWSELCKLWAVILLTSFLDCKKDLSIEPPFDITNLINLCLFINIWTFRTFIVIFIHFYQTFIKVWNFSLYLN